MFNNLHHNVVKSFNFYPYISSLCFVLDPVLQASTSAFRETKLIYRIQYFHTPFPMSSPTLLSSEKIRGDSIHTFIYFDLIIILTYLISLITIHLVLTYGLNLQFQKYSNTKKIILDMIFAFPTYCMSCTPLGINTHIPQFFSLT